MSRVPRSVCNVGQPMAHFVPTEKFAEVRAVAEEHKRTNAILYCYGFPGTGKSQIMRTLAKEFPFEDSEIVVKWHIECSGEQSIKESFRSFVRQMYKNCITPPHAQLDSVRSDIKIDRSISLVELLSELQVPVLIVVEDIRKKTMKPGDLDFLKDFQRSLAATENTSGFPIHLYIATRSQNNNIHKEESARFFDGRDGTYKAFEVKGFTQTEAVEYMFTDSGLERNESAVIEIYNRFTGSPLGLRAAKAYCKEAMIDYIEYKDMLEDDESSVQHDEAELLRDEYGTKAQHIFHAITMPFMPDSPDDAKALQQWNVLTCLSYLHFSNVPRFLIERFCQYFRQNGVQNVKRKNKTEAGFIISKLKNNELCVVDGQGISFHEVVLHAFRVTKQPIWNKSNPILCAVEVLASVSSKVMRDQKYATQTIKLMPHLHALLQHVEHKKSRLPTDVMEFKLLLIHLYEVFGAVGFTKSIGYKDTCDLSLQKAFKIILDEVEFDEGETSFPEFAKHFQERDIKQVVESLVTSCSRAGRKCGSKVGFIDKYLSKVLVLRYDSKDFQFLQRECPDDKAAIFNEIRISLETNPSTTVDIIQKLRNCGLFITEHDYCNIIFIERLASILYHLTRLVLKAKPSNEILKQRLWTSRLSHEVCVICMQKFSTGLLFEHFSQIRGTVPIILLMSKRQDDGNDAYLNIARTMCEQANNHATMSAESYPLYSHGLLRETRGGIYQTMTIQMELVRIHTKIVIRGDLRTELMEDGRDVCENLLQLASTNTDEMVAYKCIVYCGKFFSATCEHGKADKCYQKYMNEAEQSSDHSDWVWVIRNFGCNVVNGNLRHLNEKALQLCQEVKSSNKLISQYKRSQIDDLIEHLQNPQ